jgi:hypothetical protein
VVGKKNFQKSYENDIPQAKKGKTRFSVAQETTYSLL